MADPTYVPCPHCGHPYQMSPLQRDLYRGRTLSCNDCAGTFTVDHATPLPAEALRRGPRPSWAGGPGPSAPAGHPGAVGEMDGEGGGTPEGQPPAGGYSRGSSEYVLVPPKPKRDPGAWLTRLTVGGGVLLALVFLLALLLPTINRAGQNANRVKCAANMRQLGVAMTLYANANTGAFPDAVQQLTPYVTPDVFVCPSCSHTPAPGNTPQLQAANLSNGPHLSYAYVGTGLTSAAPPGQILLYEPLTNHNQSGINVLYANGTVTFLPRATAQALIPTLPPPAGVPAALPGAGSVRR